MTLKLKLLATAFICIWWHDTVTRLVECGGGGGTRFRDRNIYKGPPRNSSSIYTRLLNNLLHHDYSALAPPLCNISSYMHLKNVSAHVKRRLYTRKLIDVSVDMWLYQLFDLEESSQMLTMDVWIELNWYDCRLVWDPKDYNGIKQFTIPADDIWRPDIFVYESLHGNFEEGMFIFRTVRGRVYHNGMVDLGGQLLLRTFCRIRIGDYPYDSQKCKITFTSWATDLTLINFTRKSDRQELLNSGALSVEHTRRGHSFRDASNGEWTVLGLESVRNVRSFTRDYTTVKQNHSEVSFVLTMKRKPRYTEVYLIVPCFILLWASVFTFLIPIESGEKISVCVTVLLSLFVFLLLVAENVPHTSDAIPIITTFYLTSICLVGVCVVCTVFIINIGMKSSQVNVPNWMMACLNTQAAFWILQDKARVSWKRWQQGKRRAKQKLSCQFNADKCAAAATAAAGDAVIQAEAMQHQDEQVSFGTESCGGQRRFLFFHDAGADMDDENTYNNWRLMSILLDRIFFSVYFILTSVLTAYLIYLQQVKGRIPSGAEHHEE